MYFLYLEQTVCKTEHWQPVVEQGLVLNYGDGFGATEQLAWQAKAEDWKLAVEAMKQQRINEWMNER